MGHSVLWRHILGYAVCLCARLYELNEKLDGDYFVSGLCICGKIDKNYYCSSVSKTAEKLNFVAT